MAKAKAKFWYKVIAGDYVHERVHYLKGAIFESTIPWLAERYPEKFEKLYQPPTKRQLELVKHLITGLVPLAPGMEGTTEVSKPKPVVTPPHPAPVEETDADEGFDESVPGAPPASDEDQPPADEESEAETTSETEGETSEPADEPSEPPAKSVEEMDAVELREFATRHGIDLKGNTSVNGMRRIIRRAGVA